MQLCDDSGMLLSHQGTAPHLKIALRLDGVDIIGGGNAHDIRRQPELVDGTWIVQAMADAAVIGELRLEVGADKKLRKVTGAAHQLWNYQIETDANIAGLVKRIDEPFADALNDVLANSVDSIPSNNTQENNFDNMMGENKSDDT